MTKAPTMIHLTVTDRDGSTKNVDWEADQSLMEALRDNGLPVLASCGGEASCATCHVFLPENVVERLGDRTEDETDILDEAEHFDENRSRLSCQVRQDVLELADLSVELAPEEDF